MSSREARASGDAGTGLISTIGGVTCFLTFLLVATQVLLGLHTTSVVTGVAYDGARAVARAGHDPLAVADAQVAAEGRMRDLLGDLPATFDWSASTTDEVVLRVRADTARVLPVSWDGPVGGDHVDRIVTVRREGLP